MKKTFATLLIISLLVWTACDPGTDENPCDVDFDQSAMFQNYTNGLIIPAYTRLKSEVDRLVTKTEAFNNTPTDLTLTELQYAFFNTYSMWQDAAQYDFGPAEEVFLRNSVNNFPVDTAIVLSNINDGGYTFDSPDAYDKGLPALDYLLFNTYDSKIDILERFTTNNQTTEYKKYILDVVKDIQTRVNHTYDGWTSGDYAATFNTNTGTAAGTSLSLLVNNFNENYELIKRDKIGIPSGILTLGSINPTKTEAYYSGYSIVLAKEALQATIQMYQGESGLGLDDYLTTIGTQKNGQSLSQVILEQFLSAKDELDALSGRLSDEVDNNTILVETAYNELSKQLVNIKTDMPSVMCISITYIDNPSDSD
ncbi:MAG: imelysin family protein [Saprospiraceae bacterium]